jgi:type I restriction enzyme S subunit
MTPRSPLDGFPSNPQDGWKRFPFWAIARRRKDIGWPDEELLSVYLGRGVIRHAEASNYTHAPSEDLSGYQLVEPGDAVFNNQQAFRGCVGVSKFRGITSPAYLVYELSPELIPAYASYLLTDPLMVGQYGQVSRGVGTIQRQVSPDELRKVSAVLPPLATQRAIADYLDTETARIDALIEKKRRMVELLEERRRSVIEEGLAGGRSAVDFLLGTSGSIEVVPLKRLLADTIPGGTPDSDNSDFWCDPGEGMTWISIGDMVDRGITTSASKSVTAAGIAEARLRVGPPGTLLVAMYASMGKVTVTSVEATWNQAILGLIPRGELVVRELLSLWIEALRPHLGLLARSTTQDNLNAQQIGQLPIPDWPAEDQPQLLVAVRAQLDAISRTDARLSHQIDLLVERRQALITAAVTGDLNIHGAAA